MASSNDGFKETQNAKDFQEWIEINKSRNAHETLLDQLSTSSLSSSSSHELINQCGKGLNDVGIKGKKVRFKKKLRRAKDHNLNYRNGYYRDDRRVNRPNQLCHLIKIFSAFGGFVTLVALIFVVISMQTRLELLQIQLRSFNDHYHGMATTLSALKKKTQEHDSLIITLSTNLSACHNMSKPVNSETYDSNQSVSTTATVLSSKPNISWITNRVNNISFQLNALSSNISHLEEKMNSLSQTEDGLLRSFSTINNNMTEHSSKLEHLMALVGHLFGVIQNTNSTSTNGNL